MVENTGNRGFLEDEANEDGLYPIHGVAIGNNDITVGQRSGEPKLWRPEVLEEAAETLAGKDIVVNHENQDAYMKIGEVDEAKYEEGRGVIYRGAIDDDELAEKIARDWLEVSPRIKHSKAHEEIQGVKVPESIRDFDNLSVVRRGAAGSNELTLGETEELSVEELQASFEDEDDSVSEYQTTVDDDTLEELEEDIDYARWMYDDREGAEGAAVRFGCEGTHTREVDGETWYMPCETHDKFLQGLRETDGDEMQEGDIEIEEMELSEARRPDYDGTEEVAWDGVPADTLDFYTDALDIDANSVDDLTENQREDIASHSLLGDPDADNIRDLRLFPVVNPGTDNLNRNALVAVRGGRGQQADVPQSTYESAFAMAGRLLNEEFDADVEEEMSEHKADEYSREELRTASQMSSYSELTKSECLSLVDAFNPSRDTDYASLAQCIYKTMGDDEMEMLYSELDKRYKDKEYSESTGRDSPLNKILR